MTIDKVACLCLTQVKYNIVRWDNNNSDFWEIKLFYFILECTRLLKVTSKWHLTRHSTLTENIYTNKIIIQTVKNLSINCPYWNVYEKKSFLLLLNNQWNKIIVENWRKRKTLIIDIQRSIRFLFLNVYFSRQS